MKSFLSFITITLLATISVSAEGKINLMFPNADVREVLGIYQKLTAKRIIYDNTVQGPVNLTTATPIPNDEAIKLIENLLFADGFSLVDKEDNTIEVVGLGRNARAIGIPTYSRQEEIPKGERVFTYIFKLKNRDAVEVQQLLGQQIAPTSYSSVVADSKSSTVVVTSRTSVINGLIPIVAAFDVPPQQ
jgi:general secretion pathway protein D